VIRPLARPSPSLRDFGSRFFLGRRSSSPFRSPLLDYKTWSCDRFFSSLSFGNACPHEPCRPSCVKTPLRFFFVFFVFFFKQKDLSFPFLPPSVVVLVLMEIRYSGKPGMSGRFQHSVFFQMVLVWWGAGIFDIFFPSYPGRLDLPSLYGAE